MTVASRQRFSRNHTCPVCDGYGGAPRGRGERCYGFLSDDGAYAHCTREEKAGGLPLEEGAGTYAHRLTGECRCGTTHGTTDGTTNGSAPREERQRVVARYDYVDERSELLYQIERLGPRKDFRIRRPHPTKPGRWIFHMNTDVKCGRYGCACDRAVLPELRIVPYRLPDVISTVAAARDHPDDPAWTVNITEGEQDSDSLAKIGLVATTNPFGAGKWPADFGEYVRGGRVVVIADKDQEGRGHAQNVARSCYATARSVKVVEVPPDAAKDAADWIALGATRAEFERLADEAPSWTADATADHAQTDGTNGERDFALTDLGNAERLVARHGDDVRYIGAMREWYAWDGQRFRVDDTGEVERRAKETARAIYGEAEAANDVRQRRELAAHAVKSESAPKIAAMITLAQSEAKIALRAAELDVDPWLFNVANGTLDLRSGELRPHSREHLITKISPIEYDPDAQCPIWLAFLDRILVVAELIGFVRRAVGYALTGDTSEQKLLLLYGTGANGKSTLLELLRALLGDYARHSDFSTFLAQRGDSVRNDIARLRGARLVTATEIEGGRALAEVVIKQLTGSDTVTARQLYAEFFEFRPTFKLFLAANHKPVIRGTDYAIWRRICLVPFKVTIPAAEQDPQLADKLRAELPGILAWAVRGCLEWQIQRLDAPAAVLTATEDYRGEMDTLGDFLEERCVVEADASVTAKAIYQCYAAWATANGEKPMAKNAFGMRLAERGFKRAIRSGGAERLWRGLRLGSTEPLL